MSIIINRGVVLKAFYLSCSSLNSVGIKDVGGGEVFNLT